MYRQWWPRLVAFVLLAVGFCCALSTTASAESTVETFKAPNVEPKETYAHGDGSVTVANNNCSSYPKESAENGAVTVSSEGVALSGIPRVEGEWDTTTCANYIAAGFDSTMYVVQVGQAAKNYPHRVIAVRNSVTLWTTSFADPAGCGGRIASIQSMALAQDGNLYAAISWAYKSEACPEKDGLVSVDTSTGAIRFTNVLPNTAPGRSSSLSEIMPYENGVAILNGNEVFYYDYAGTKESSKTFSAVPGKETITEMKVMPETGRIFWYTQIYNAKINEDEKFLYYRDPAGGVSNSITLPEKRWPVSIFATPYNGVAVTWKDSQKGSLKGLDYIDKEGSLVYEKTLSSETGYSVNEVNQTSGTMVDDLGNVIVRRVMTESTGDHDRNVVIDSFSPAGIKTRIFNSSSLGTSKVLDSFASTTPLPRSMAEGRVYLAMCHVTGEITESCSLTKNPIVVSIEDTTIGEYDYPRSAIFSEGKSSLSYVALGDSYSSGEGVPSFIPPSDEDGCHRSYDAYPVKLTGMWVPGVKLSAFVACSGAKTSDVKNGMSGEPSQLNSLNSDTDIVTITIGGNDIGFVAFATECVLFTCDSSSSAYKYSMEQIALYLPEKLEELYVEIHERAENAKVYVVGYPQVVGESEPACGVIFAKSEEEASRKVVSALDAKIREAAEAAEGEFIYVDPNTETSPFFGHELCGEEAESYFNGFKFPEKGYSFHPNMNGQEAYAILVSEAL